MKTEYKRFLQKQNRYNKWELDYISNLSIEEKLDQFVELFELKPKDEILQAKHHKHLNSLIKNRKYFKSKAQK